MAEHITLTFFRQSTYRPWRFRMGPMGITESVADHVGQLVTRLLGAKVVEGIVVVSSRKIDGGRCLTIHPMPSSSYTLYRFRRGCTTYYLCNYGLQRVFNETPETIWFKKL